MDRTVVYSVNKRGWCNITYILSDAFRYSSHSSLSGFLEHFKR